MVFSHSSSCLIFAFEPLFSSLPSDIYIIKFLSRSIDTVLSYKVLFFGEYEMPLFLEYECYMLLDANLRPAKYTDIRPLILS